MNERQLSYLLKEYELENIKDYQLRELINLLIQKNKELMETIEDISNNQDREESEPRYDRSDMD